MMERVIDIFGYRRPASDKTGSLSRGEAKARYAYGNSDWFFDPHDPAGTTTYLYDAAGRISMVAAPNFTVSYGYPAWKYSNDNLSGK